MNTFNAIARSVSITAILFGPFIAHADKNPITRLNQTHITLQQAITLAETHLGGRAYEAELEEDSFTLEYEVKIAKEDQRYKITVDAQSGEIKHVRERK